MHRTVRNASIQHTRHANKHNIMAACRASQALLHATPMARIMQRALHCQCDLQTQPTCRPHGASCTPPPLAAAAVRSRLGSQCTVYTTIARPSQRRRAARPLRWSPHLLVPSLVQPMDFLLLAMTSSPPRETGPGASVAPAKEPAHTDRRNETHGAAVSALPPAATTIVAARALLRTDIFSPNRQHCCRCCQAPRPAARHACCARQPHCPSASRPDNLCASCTDLQGTSCSMCAAARPRT